MNINYIQVLKHNWQTITLISLVLVVLTLGFSLLQPLQYRSRVDLLVVQKQALNMDAYSAARASEKMAKNLAVVVQTKSFFEEVVKSNLGIRRNDFPANERKLRRVWRKKVRAKISPETSLLTVSVFDTDKAKANELAAAVAYILVNNASEYYGIGQNIIIKVVNEPLVSNYPVKPNIILNTLSALIVGLLLGSAWVFYQYKSKFNELLDDVPNQRAASGLNFFSQKYNDNNKKYQTEPDFLQQKLMAMYNRNE